ncbi:MAG: DUF6785 family protein [Armatimonadota bacterium]
MAAETAKEHDGASDQRRDAVTARAVVIGLALSIIFSLIVPYIDVYMSDTFLGSCHLPPGAVFALLVLVLVVNPLLRLARRRWALGRMELLTIYCMLLFSTLVPGHGAENVFIPVAITPHYYATPENRWDDLFFAHIPEWFAPRDEGVVEAFYEGLRPGAPMPWSAWARPLAAWTLLSFFTYGLVLSLSIVFRKQWVDRERIAFPLVPLPLEMTAKTERPLSREAFLGSRIMWIGAGLAIAVQLLNGLNFHFPQVPAIPMMNNLRPWFTSHPWSAIGVVRANVWPAVIGLTVLLRTEVSFSLWFFYWVDKLQLVVAAMLGQTRRQATVLGRPGFLAFQPIGGYIAYAALAFWAARPHLREFLATAVGRGPRTDDAGEALSCRAAAVLGLVCFGGMVAWATVAGMSVWAAAAQMLVYLVLAVVLTKVVAEAGLLFVQSTMSSVELMVSVAGTAAVGARSLTVATFIERSYMTDQRAFIMPSFVQSFKIADVTGMDKRRLLPALLVTVAIATVLCYWVNLKLLYVYGGLQCNRWYVQGAGPGGFRLLASLLQSPRPVSGTNIIAGLAGAGVTLGLFALRQRFLWFPAHPVGYIMALTYPLRQLWFSLFLGWLAKAVVMRYLGPRGLVGLLPLFLGIAFGDIVMMVVWLIVDAATGTHGHYLMPG